MLKYIDAKVVFQEIPDEITLCVNITGCKIGCKGCHSSYLAGDIGNKLTFDELLKLYSKNSGVTCISFMGGDSEPAYINKMAEVLRERELPVKIAWYSGRQELSPDIDLRNFDYIKLGPYIEEKGPLNSRTTNQIMLKIDHDYEQPIVVDITSRFWK